MADLARAIRAEVQEDQLVTCLDPTAAIADHNGLDELVGHTRRVRGLDRRRHVGCLRTNALYEEPPCPFHTLPARVAIHRMNASADIDNAGGASLPLVGERRQQDAGLLGRDIAAVRQRMDRNVRDALRGGQPHEST